ncbi:palmitoyltransferase [Coemansia aciculifera]|uniref:Synaptobrevin homolog YKT6 n=1 Tax=Coemansia aciculifera TaxID=417176 RepID=A0A9W8IEM8_9FUNG|nr:palmitoyltransferase [Coemansia aciculifera]
MKAYHLALVRPKDAAAQRPTQVLSSESDVSSFSFFQRGSVEEFLEFFSVTVAERTQVGQRQGVEENENFAYTYRSSNNLCAVVITDREYPGRVALGLAAKMIDEYTKVHDDRFIDSATGKAGFVVLKEFIGKYQDPKQADSIMRVQQELDETKVVLHKTIESVLERGEKLDALVDRSNQLSSQSKMFYKTAKKTNSCCIVMDMEDSRDIPKAAHSTEAERLAAEAAAEAGWRWPRVRMMAQSPDLQESTEVRQPKQQKKHQRSAWTQVRRLISEVTEVFDDHVSNSSDPAYSAAAQDCGGDDSRALPSAAAEYTGVRNPAAWIVAAWVLLVAIDWAVSSTVMPRVVTWISAQHWTMASAASDSIWWWADEALAWIQVDAVSSAVALTRPFALQWWCFFLFTAMWVTNSIKHSHSRKGGRARGMLAYAMYFAVADAVLMAVLAPKPQTLDLGPQTLGLRPQTLGPLPTSDCEIGSGCALQHATIMTPFADAVERQAQRARQLQQAASAEPSDTLIGCGTALFATAAMYGAVGLRLRAWSGMRLRTSAVLFAADVGLRHNAGAALVGQSSWFLAAHVISGAALLAFREAAVAVQAMRSWHAAVVRERRRGGPLMMQTSAAKSKAHQGPLSPRALDHLARGGAYAHRVCFLCLSGCCERCLLSMPIWPTTSEAGSSADLPPALPLEYPAREDAPVSEADPATEALPLSPTRPAAAPVVAAGRRRVRKHGRTTVVHMPAESAPANESHSLEALPALGLSSASLVPVSAGTRRGRTLDMWIICSVAHCPCRSVHGPGPSAFVSKSLSSVKESRAGSPFTLPVGSMMELPQYVAELHSLGLVRPVNPAAMANAGDDFAASVFPYVFGRFAVPEHKGPAAAANALLASRSGYTPGSAPFLAAVAGVCSWSAEEPQVPRSRIIMTPTPLLMARNADPGATFRLNAEAVRSEADGGCVLVTVAMTPALANSLLKHPKVVHTAAVCVPAALLAPNKANADTAAISDADPFLDYLRVQIARADVVVRVNGARWLYYEFGSLALNQPIVVRRLPVGSSQPLAISLSICGMRSEDLCVLIPSPKPAVPVTPVVDKDQELVAEAEKEKARLAAATQSLKRAKREAPKSLAHWEAQLETVRKSLDRNAAADGKLESKRRHLELAVGALRTAVQALTEEQSGNRSDPELPPSSTNQTAIGSALARLRAAETEARQLRDAHAHDIQELDADRAAWTEKLSEVARKIEPLERSLIDPLQRDLRDVSRRFLVSRNVESKLQAKLRKELWACNDLAKERPAVGGELTRDLADIKKNIAREKAEIKLLNGA